MRNEKERSGCAIARALLFGVVASFVLVTSPSAMAQSGPWASCPDGSQVETATAFGSPHLAGYGGNLTPELLQAAAFVALTLPDERPTVEPIVAARLRANGVQVDQTDWDTLINAATSGVDNNAVKRGLLYSLITGPLGDLERTDVPGILKRSGSGALFARGVVTVDTRACVLYPILDKLIQSPCQMSAGDALYLAARAASNPQAACLELDGLQMNEGPGLLVAVERSKLGASVSFQVLRSATAQIDQNAQKVWSGQATIKRDQGGIEYALVAQDVSLVPDPSRPFLLIDTIPIPAEKSASCEQPVPNRGYDQTNLDLGKDGLHGPYASTIDAAQHDAAGLIALRNTGSKEWGFEIVRDQRRKTGGYYTTTPVESSQSLLHLGPPVVETKDYDKSFNAAFGESCERRPDFLPVAATVHTHPLNPTAPDNFSEPDFEGAIVQKHDYPEAFEQIFMINVRDRKLRMFTPSLDPNAYSNPAEADQWTKYVNHVVVICTYPASFSGPCQ